MENFSKANIGKFKNRNFNRKTIEYRKQENDENIVAAEIFRQYVVQG